MDKSREKQARIEVKGEWERGKVNREGYREKLRELKRKREIERRR